jgi:hypothetical protein
MSIEPRYGEAMSIWRGILVFSSDRYLRSQATEIVVERRNNGRVFNGRVKMEMDSAV